MSKEYAFDAKLVEMGLYAPFGGYEARWWMTFTERLALIGLLHLIKPRLSIEIGTHYGGSLAVIAHYSERVFALDLDPTIPERLRDFRNVEFVIGDSAQTLPTLLEKIVSENLPLDFVLIDGDHSKAGVRRDCQQFVGYCPLQTTYIVMHDSYNPQVRAGIESAGWQNSPHVHALALDFVRGVPRRKGFLTEMWGGFALSVLNAHGRQHPLIVDRRRSWLYGWQVLTSVHNPLLRGMARMLRLYPP